jgi:hypothetical protein
MWFKKRKIDSAEYIELKKDIAMLNLQIESLSLDVKLYKNKLRSRAKIDSDEKEKDFNNSVLLPEA